MPSSITITTVLVGLLNILIGGLLVAVVKARPALRKIAADREANLLSERAKEMESMRVRITEVEARLGLKDKQIEAERALYRHRITNLGAAFNALLMLLKKGVSVEEAVEEVEKMRAEQLEREAVEAATFRAAGLDVWIDDQ